MLEQILNGGSFVLRNVVQKDPGIIVGPITQVFGYLMNLCYNLTYAISPSEANTLGFSIILLTLIAKLIMLPLGIKSQKSMSAMQSLQPELDKIKEKYGNSEDPEIKQRMAMEQQELYQKNGANPIAGCLPMFVQFPIFMGLYYIMNQSYKFIDILRGIYQQIAALILSIPNFFDIISPIAISKIPSGMTLDLAIEADLVKVLSKFVLDDWAQVLSQIPAETAANMQVILDRKISIESFFTIGLTENTGLYWPAIIIPILSVIASFLSSYLSNKQSKSNDPNMKMQQNIMMVVMPVMMGFITVGMPGGVGLYWVVSSTFQVVQQVALNKIFNKPDDKQEIVDPKPVNNKKPANKSSKK